MKKIAIIYLILALSCVTGFSLETEENGLTGSWKTHVLLAEGEDGLLVNPDAEYAFPFLGITEIDILDSGFILFLINDNEYRAFYEVEMLDFDNYHLTCTFKNGEEFLLKLVRLEGESWKFLYRISSDSVLAAADENDEQTSYDEDEQEAVYPEDLENMDDQTGIADRTESLFVGILIRE
jgi:hypothetical protein